MAEESQTEEVELTVRCAHKMPLAESNAENACGIKIKNAWDVQQPNIIVDLFKKKNVGR